MRTVTFLVLTLLTLALAPGADAAPPGTAGPVIEGFGPVHDVPDPGIPLPPGHVYRVVFDVAGSPDDAGMINPRIVTVARFLNMHARAGVPLDHMHLALVIHGSAGKDALSQSAYQARHGAGNPNLELLDRLGKAGVEIILCGQTAAHRGYERRELAPGIKVALSAMTALSLLQDQGFALIAF